MYNGSFNSYNLCMSSFKTRKLKKFRIMSLINTFMTLKKRKIKNIVKFKIKFVCRYNEKQNCNT